MQELLQAIRRGCSPAAWSDAVTLARSGNVSGVAQRPGEVDLRVAEIGGLKTAQVTLYPDDEEWTCDCDSTADACKHVAAAAIALNKQGKALFATATLAHVGYRLRTEDGALVFDRALVQGETEAPLTTSLSEAATKTKLAATDTDMTVEILLGTRPRGALIAEHWRKLWPKLKECEDVTVDGAHVTLDDPKPLETLVITDRGQDFALTLVPTKGAWSNGVAREGDRIFVSRAHTLDDRELAVLRKGQRVARDDVPALVTDVLPKLQDALPVDVQTTRLPRQEELTPRLVYDVAPQGNGVSVLATIVYGDPPAARIDGDRLHWLQGPLPIRKPREEQRLQQIVKDKLNARVGERRFVTGDDAPAVLQAVGAGFAGEGRVTAETKDGALRLSLQAGKQTIDHDALVHALRSGQSLLALNDGTFTAIPRALCDLELVARLFHGRHSLDSTERLDAVRVLQALDTPLPPDLAPLHALFTERDLPAAELPTDLQATLRPYQKDGVDWLVFLRQAGLGALLADDMGLGKTLQTIASLPAKGPHLVVTPASVLGVWERELAKFRPSLTVQRFHGARRTIADKDVTLTTYGTLRADPALASREWATVILDEAQAVKNPDSQTARACFALKAEHRVALSGTPIENSLDELWSVFRFIAPGYLGERDTFATRAPAEIRAKIRPFILRRRKETVAKDLPPRTDDVLACELSDEERAIYDAVYQANAPAVLRALGEESNVLSALEALLRLRQAASHPRLLPGYETWAGVSAKLQTLSAMIEQLVAEGHKALIFSQWTSFLDLVKLPCETTRLDGSTKDRKAVVDAFERPDGPPVMLISLKAGGTGLTLTAADYVFLLDPWWNPAVEEQAAARAHRIGQTKPVFVYRLIAKDTVEERLLALQQAKRELFDAALGDEALAGRLTKDDLRALLS